MVNNYLPRKIADDFVFIYRKEEFVRVFGAGDAAAYKQELEDSGYVHTTTLSTSVFLEKLINCPDMGDAIDMIINIEN